MEMMKGIHRIKVPLGNNPLGFVNSYLLQTEDGCILIDCGWNTEEAFAALAAGIAAAGCAFDDIRVLIITHIHPDHIGLAGRLPLQPKTRVILHEVEWRLLDNRKLEYERLVQASEEWLRINGVPKASIPLLQAAWLHMLDLIAALEVNHPVSSGECISLGDITLEVLGTPGHSMGHICLYDKAHGALFTGDHLLEQITPNVSMNSQEEGNPLADYRNSLLQVRNLDVELLLPGHGNAFGELATRVDAILEHHDQRLAEVLQLCRKHAVSAFEIAQRVKWFRPWSELPLFSQRNAVTEITAHLEMLFSLGHLRRDSIDGVYRYTAR